MSPQMDVWSIPTALALAHSFQPITCLFCASTPGTVTSMRKVGLRPLFLRFCFTQVDGIFELLLLPTQIWPRQSTEPERSLPGIGPHVQ